MESYNVTIETNAGTLWKKEIHWWAKFRANQEFTLETPASYDSAQVAII